MCATPTSSASAFANADGAVITRSLIEAIAANRQALSDIDGLIGDGDHGVNMNKGFQQCREQLPADATLSSSFRLLGNVLLEIGGSMGPLYSAVFRAMGKVGESHEYIDAGVFEQMLAEAERQVRLIGSCQPGEKTLLDVLAPAHAAFAAARSEGARFDAALAAMRQAAEAGRASTINMVAQKGRASRLGERSRGVPDPGATSCCLLLCTMADQGANLLNAQRLSCPEKANDGRSASD